MEAFGHTAMGADKPRAPRPKVQATGKNKAMIIAGLILHLTGTAICLGWLGIIPNPFASKPTSRQPPPKVEQERQGPRRRGRRTPIGPGLTAGTPMKLVHQPGDDPPRPRSRTMWPPSPTCGWPAAEVWLTKLEKHLEAIVPRRPPASCSPTAS